MEAYYKARKKKLTFYARQIKKLHQAGEKEQAKSLRKEYVKFLLEPPPPRDLYMSEGAYLKELKKSIRALDEEFIMLKLDLCYDLDYLLEGMEEYGSFEENPRSLSLRKTEKYLLEKKNERENQMSKDKKKEEKEYQDLVSSFPFIDREDKPKVYLEIEKMAEAMSNPQRKVIAYEIENKELEYRLTQLYDPWIEVKIKGTNANA
jgi:hypothetical protein